MFVFFFFSSRRRHTRCLSDWSSDVCSSDLELEALDGLPLGGIEERRDHGGCGLDTIARATLATASCHRSEEHTSELQSLRHLVCRLLLEKKKNKKNKKSIAEQTKQDSKHIK